MEEDGGTPCTVHLRLFSITPFGADGKQFLAGTVSSAHHFAITPFRFAACRCFLLL